jgi:hypothetical protein
MNKQKSRPPHIQVEIDPGLKKDIDEKLKNSYLTKSQLLRVLLGWFATGKFDRELEACGLRYCDKKASITRRDIEQSRAK